MKIRSGILNEKRTLLIHSPQDYNKGKRSYPVLYVLDAYDQPSTFGPSFYQVSDQVEEMAAEGVPPMIVIGVVNTVRARDMIPVKTDYYPESGQADRFLAFFAGELIPNIDERFRTSGERLIYGRSDSGLFVLYALLERPDTFSAYISSSPTVGFCPGLVCAKTRKLFDGQVSLKKDLFIIYGDNDIPLVKSAIPDVIGLFQSLAPGSFRFKAHAVPSGGHIPASSLYEGLRYIYSQGRLR